jgi:DNA-binding FrmR family transcriptional regulator
VLYKPETLLGDDMSHKNQKAVINRLKRAQGHLSSIISMVEEEKNCTEVAHQMSAVISALKAARQVLLEDHIEHCILDHTADKEPELAMDEIKEILKIISL